MIRAQRQTLFTGPFMTIYVGSNAIHGIYKRVGMALSSEINRYFTKNPTSLEYRFPDGAIDASAVRVLLLSWPRSMSQEFEAYGVPMLASFGENVALLRAARLLGMERYARHTLVTFVDYFKAELPSYEEIAIVEQNATSDKDPLWTAMVNHLCHDRYKQLMPDPEEFAAFLEHHPRLKTAMEAADAYFAGAAKKKLEAGRAQVQAKEDERRARWKKNGGEKRERIAEEKA
jgi:hypothetical protein